LNKMGMEDDLIDDFMFSLQHRNEDRIKQSWQEYNSYVRNLKALNINYKWQRYNLVQKIYEEWKTSLKNKKTT